MQNKKEQAIADNGWKRNKIKKALKNKPAKRKQKKKFTKEKKCCCRKKKEKRTLHKYFRKLAKRQQNKGLVNEMRRKAWNK